MKRLAILLIALAMVSRSIVIVTAQDAAPQQVEITVAETGAVEDPSHPFLFGQQSGWEVSVDFFRSEAGDQMQMTSPQLANLLSLGAVRCTVEIPDGKKQLEKTPSIAAKDDTAVLQLQAVHTFDTKSSEIILRLRLRMVRNIYWDKVKRDYSCALYNENGDKNELILQRGTVLEGSDMLFTAHYCNLSSYHSTIQITAEDVQNCNVVADGEELYMATDSNKMITFQFGAAAAYTTRISAAQKAVNLYYSLDEIEGVASMYPDISFSYVSFSGEPSFIDSGELTFAAAGGEDTVVYSYDGELLSPMITVYNAQENTVTVRGIKRLGTYVVASESVENYIPQPEQQAAVPVRLPIRVVTESNPSTG